MCCSDLERVAACCSVLQRVAACCVGLQRVADASTRRMKTHRMCCSVLQRVAVCCSVALCFSVLQCVADAS